MPAIYQVYLLDHLNCNSNFGKTAPKLGPIVNNQRRDVNSSLRLFCDVQQGVQPFFFEWFKNNQPIKAGPGVKWEIENAKKLSTLTIERIDKNDAGNYSCLVKNIYGSDSLTVSLTVKGTVLFIILF